MITAAAAVAVTALSVVGTITPASAASKSHLSVDMKVVNGTDTVLLPTSGEPATVSDGGRFHPAPRPVLGIDAPDENAHTWSASAAHAFQATAPYFLSGEKLYMLYVNAEVHRNHKNRASCVVRNMHGEVDESEFHCEASIDNDKRAKGLAVVTPR
ncbi:hypothetical protein C6N75_07510 [Streptomyces solincola]|uniref:Uncharacterized protein n=1 Tax=Streptomyces solincola TaxID=2100817 RepID=A0A2S9PZI5_9ACTN|nr:hypothetical protein [Streptomyces solincola]PRH79840.1 hypothetical protein C6N75_07510 [Streptomyces solincola]